MLTIHFTLAETTHCPDMMGAPDAAGLRDLAKAETLLTMEHAKRAMLNELMGRYGSSRGVEPYNQDGGEPFVQLLLGDWQRDGGLDCATEWCERYKGQGLHAGLVVEGKPTGAIDSFDPHRREVVEGDWDRLVVDTFARHFDALLGDSPQPWFRLDECYCVTDWAYYDSQSDWIIINGLDRAREGI